ncbi:Cha4 [Kluyveromyces lactis]|nr:Cha4 [Kluyveromyces lactis]
MSTITDGKRRRKAHLACQNCRIKRRKCDMERPCSNCLKYGIECITVNNDKRTKRTTHEYVEKLEAEIDDLKRRIEKMKSETLEGTPSNSLPPRNPSWKPFLAEIRSPTPSSPNMQSTLTKNNQVVSSSIYSNDSLAITKIFSNDVNRDMTTSNLRTLSRSPVILPALSLFFKWLYPGHYTFIHRETFLSALFGEPSTKAYYCSKELVFAIAALGSKLADKNEELYKKSQEYYTLAKTKVLNKIFQLDGSTASYSSSSKLGIIQTLLCLAFYDIGNGENPLAWYESGLAFRMAHEIGLHLNPEAWDDVYDDKLSQIDIEVRSRIYWGCYIADHLIAVLFGRSNSLRVSNSTIPETDELPNIDTGIEDYQYDPTIVTSIAKPLKKIIVLSRITEVFAPKIFIHAGSLTERREYLTKFNSEVSNWRKNLPDEFALTKATLINFDYNPILAHVWYHYFVILLSYNKPFIDSLPESKQAIENAIEELYFLLRSFMRKFKTFQKSNIYMLYSSILAIQCIKTGSIKKDNLSIFLEFLGSPSLNYELAKKFYDNEMKLPKSSNTNANTGLENTALLGSLSNGNEFAFEYNFDFTLLNEIDKLIGGDITMK